MIHSLACPGGAGQKLKHTFRLTMASGLVLGLATGAWTQDVPPRLVFDLSSRLSLDDNPDLAPGGSGPQARLDTDLGLTLNGVTRDQNLRFSLTGLMQINDEGLAFRDPSIRLSYGREAANSRISVSGALSQSPVDLFEPVFSEEGGVIITDILATTGTVSSRNAELSFATGLQDPLGFDLSASVTGRDYSDTSDPAVFDSSSRSLSLGVQLRQPSAGRQISLTLRGSSSDFDNLTNTSREDRSLSFGYSQDLRPDLRLQASLGQTWSDSRLGGVADLSSAGATGSLGLEAELANGSASVTLASDRDVLGPRQTLQFSRSLALPDGTLEATLGLSSRPGEAGQLVADLRYAQDLGGGSLTVSLSREIVLNAASQDVANTVLDVNYEHDINDRSRLGLSLNLLGTGSGGTAGVTEAQRQSFTASYSRDLIADWQVTAGYQVRGLDTSAAAAARSNTVFLSVSRRFTLRP